MTSSAFSEIWSSGSGTEPVEDCWSAWLSLGRGGGDSARERAVHIAIGRFVERVLDASMLSPHMTLLDIGTGDGAVAFRAIDRYGPGLRVIMTDLSLPVLTRVMAQATERGVSTQCRFVQGNAERLEGIDDASVDAVAMRAVLAYITGKDLALAEALRVLKPGGRLSLAEPLFQEDALAAISLRRLAESMEYRDPLLTLIHRCKSAQFPDTLGGLAASSLTSHSERDLIRLAEECGFVDIHMELHIDVRAVEPQSWQAFIHASPHPLAPSLATIMRERFTSEECKLFESTLRPVVQAGATAAADRIVYLSARR